MLYRNLYGEGRPGGWSKWRQQQWGLWTSMWEETQANGAGPGLEEGAARLTLRPRGPSYSHQQPGASAACSPTGLAQSLRAGNVAEDGGKLTRLLGAIPLQPAGCALPHPVLLFPWHLGGHVQEGLWGPYSLALCPWEVSCQTRGRES